jgi:hypothetical protein
MHTGSDLLETWIPAGGFAIERRKLKKADGGSAVTDCVVPKWPDDELTRDLPCARQPCLHRIFAECPPSLERIASLASRYGLLTASIPRASAPGQVLRADALPPEPVEIWRKEIPALRASVELWDSVSGQESGTPECERLNHQIAGHLARVPFHLKISGQSLRYCPVTLSAALWQRFAAEVAGLIHPARCAAPNCGRWFLRGAAARSDKRFCSNACKNRSFRWNQRQETVI